MWNIFYFPFQKQLILRDFLRFSVKRLTTVKDPKPGRKTYDLFFRKLISTTAHKQGNIVFLKIQILCKSKKCFGFISLRKITGIHQKLFLWRLCLILTGYAPGILFSVEHNVCKTAADLSVILRTRPGCFPFVNLPVWLHGSFGILHIISKLLISFCNRTRQLINSEV